MKDPNRFQEKFESELVVVEHLAPFRIFETMQKIVELLRTNKLAILLEDEARLGDFSGWQRNHPRTGSHVSGAGGIIRITAVGLLFGTAFLTVRGNLWPLIITHAILDTLSFVQNYLGE